LESPQGGDNGSHAEPNGGYLQLVADRADEGLVNSSATLELEPNQRLMRAARITRLVVAAGLLVSAIAEPDPVGRALACLGAFVIGSTALLIPRGRTPLLVATAAGVETRLFGFLAWDEVSAIRVRQRRRYRILEVYERDRDDLIRRTRPRLLQAWMILTKPFHLPLLKFAEPMASFDAVEVRAQLEGLAHRAFPDA
jgi:hypothetical protein